VRGRFLLASRVLPEIMETHRKVFGGSVRSEPMVEGTSSIDVIGSREEG